MSEFSVLFKKAVGCKLFDVLEWLSKKKKKLGSLITDLDL